MQSHWTCSIKTKEMLLAQILCTSRGHDLSMPSERQYLNTVSIASKFCKLNSRSTSCTLCLRIWSRTLGFSSSFSTLAMIASANSFCWRCLTCASYRTHESRAVLASCASAVFCSSSKACASNLAVSYHISHIHQPYLNDTPSTPRTKPLWCQSLRSSP